MAPECGTFARNHRCIDANMPGANWLRAAISALPPVLAPHAYQARAFDGRAPALGVGV